MLSDVIKIMLPSLAVFITAYVVIKAFFHNETTKMEAKYGAELDKYNFDSKQKNKELITPIRLQAYERFVLLLERIAPASLIIRVNKSGMTVKNLQFSLLEIIREEFEHNLSQQLYISSEAWEMIVNAKEETIRIVNTVAAKIPDNNPSSELARKIIETSMIGELPASPALELLKKEIKQLY